MTRPNHLRIVPSQPVRERINTLGAMVNTNMPLQAFEVASYSRPSRWLARVVGLVAFCAIVGVLLAIAGA